MPTRFIPDSGGEVKSLVLLGCHKKSAPARDLIAGNKRAGAQQNRMSLLYHVQRPESSVDTFSHRSVCVIESDRPSMLPVWGKLKSNDIGWQHTGLFFAPYPC